MRVKMVEFDSAKLGENQNKKTPQCLANARKLTPPHLLLPASALALSSPGDELVLTIHGDPRVLQALQVLLRAGGPALLERRPQRPRIEEVSHRVSAVGDPLEIDQGEVLTDFLVLDEESCMSVIRPEICFEDELTLAMRYTGNPLCRKESSSSW